MAELERRLANVVRFATITEVDPGNARARVTFGRETASAWLHFSTARAGGARVWSPPVTGEQVVVLSPMGDTGQGIIMGSLPSNAFPAPSGDGGTYRIDMPGGVSISVAGGSISITAPGNVVVNGDVIADGISLTTHVHGGVQSGGSNTSEPSG
ncbi:phage baseplate assembly protein V [Paracoccus aestuariivivens]|uniref:Phage baseplate assembly protein V n=1 Tax=Paracoccus aestuariivivens TaxID=1820333 RepID=A0A6L6JFU3_9RHOB|nr:phage baseplate assembly protein V [Paracoccus aestuariivivens]